MANSLLSRSKDHHHYQHSHHCRHNNHRNSRCAPEEQGEEEELTGVNDDEEESMEDDDDDTVVGTCLHCNAPPPPRKSSRSCTIAYSGGVGGGVYPCGSAGNSITATSAATSPSAATRVQVSCDDCRSFICDACHWCHEFQANHEIRVCDRCDAFYCRGCDEMDQCEDCSEVVCNTCSTLMSCKFCGCGLCEDCATACGRCGIVLCARDAKFAVECDTCRMSYCLVCLASGTKDPCVRCGHRPSKRVEQLVHLRLKSIYKAFKQSGASSGTSGSGGGAGGCGRVGDGQGRGGGDCPPGPGGKYSSALRSLAENGPGDGVTSSGGKDSFSNFDQSMASEVAAVLQTASNSMAAADGSGVDYVGADGHRHPRREPSHHCRRRPSSRDRSPIPGGRGRSSSMRGSGVAAERERYFRKNQAEMEAAAAAAEAEAEAAAAALLAELDEEKASSNVINSKKSRKKKKKKEKRKEAAAAAAEQQLQHKKKNHLEPPAGADDARSVKKDVKYNDINGQKIKGGSKKASPPNSGSKDIAKRTDLIEEESSDEDMNFEQLVAGSKGTNNTRPSKKGKKEENCEDNKIAPASKPKPETPPPLVEAPTPVTADFDAELAVLLSNEDEDGLETFLANLKGVPGLGAARKTAKKALKRIREARRPLQPAPPLSDQQRDKHQAQTSGGTNKSFASGALSETKSVAKASSKAAVPLKQSTRMSNATAPAPAPAATLTVQPSSTGLPHEPLLRVVSRTQSSIGATSVSGARVGPSSTAPSSSLSSNPAQSVPAVARAECVMHMSPAVVGWVIGKGGSRIRDMMEESGAKIWIDQESMGAKEARVVYVSGKRSGVDAAVMMIKDLVSKAPVAASAAAAVAVLSRDATTGPAPSPASSAPLLARLAVVPSVAPSSSPNAPARDLPVLEGAVAPKEPVSFAAAITGSSGSPATLVTSNSIPAVSSKLLRQPRQPHQPHQQQASTSQLGWAPMAPTASAKLSTDPPVSALSHQAPPLCMRSALPSRSTNASGSSRSDTGTSLPETITSELPCDPRFVPLLIGRRGWTVKNIQSESGADLHIDQSSEPTRIIISGRTEEVRVAEGMVQEVLKYPHTQLRQQQEVLPASRALPKTNNPNAIGIDGGLSLSGAPSRTEPNAVGETRNMMLLADKSASASSSPMLLPTPNSNNDAPSSSVPLPTSLQRDCSTSTTPNSLDEFQPKSVPAAEEAMKFLPSYAQYQQSDQSSNLHLFQNSSSAAASRISEFLPNNDQHQLLPASVEMDPNTNRAQSQDWSQRSAPMRTPYSTLPPFPNMQLGSTADQYLLLDPNTSALSHCSHQQISPHENAQPPRRPSSFALPPLQDHHVHFPQSLETPVHQQTPMPPPQVQQTHASLRIKDFIHVGDGSSHSMNRWELPANGHTIGGETWNHGHDITQAHTFQHRTAAPPPLSNNHLPMQNHPVANTPGVMPTSSQPAGGSNSQVSDDSLMVDSMFASLGASGTAEGDGGLLNALNSVSLGGVPISQQMGMNSWGSRIAGWAGEDVSSSSFSQHSRLGDYREER